MEVQKIENEDKAKAAMKSVDVASKGVVDMDNDDAEEKEEYGEPYVRFVSRIFLLELWITLFAVESYRTRSSTSALGKAEERARNNTIHLSTLSSSTAEERKREKEGMSSAPRRAAYSPDPT